MEKIKKVGIIVSVVIVIIFLTLFVLTNCSSTIQNIKRNWQAETTGIDRTVNVYGINGDFIYTVSGQLDVEADSDTNRVKLTNVSTGERTLIYGETAIIIVTEN